MLDHYCQHIALPKNSMYAIVLSWPITCVEWNLHWLILNIFFFNSMYISMWTNNRITHVFLLFWMNNIIKNIVYEKQWSFYPLHFFAFTEFKKYQKEMIIVNEYPFKKWHFGGLCVHFKDEFHDNGKLFWGIKYMYKHYIPLLILFK